MKNKFSYLVNKIIFNNNNYWHKFNFVGSNKYLEECYQLTCSSSMFDIKIEWFLNFSPSGISRKEKQKFILHVYRLEESELVMYHGLTGLFGDIFDTDKELLTKLYSYLNEDEIFKQYQRERKLKRIIYLAECT